MRATHGDFAVGGAAAVLTLGPRGQVRTGRDRAARRRAGASAGSGGGGLSRGSAGECQEFERQPRLAAAQVEAPFDREFRRALARELAERALTKAAARAKEAA